MNCITICVWSTKHRAPLLTAEIEPIIYQYLRHKAQSLEAIIHALNGAEDHVHMVATIPPKLAVAQFVGQVKGVASTRFNKEHKAHPSFFWQTEYSALSFDKKRLPYVVAYVEHQKEHHAQNELIPLLERDGTENQQKTIHDSVDTYLPNYAQWLKEMHTI